MRDLLSIGQMARLSGLGRLLLALCLFQLAFNGVNSIETLYLISTFAAQPWQIGTLLALTGIAVVVAQQAMGRAVAHYGERRIALVGLFGQAVGALAVVLTTSLWFIYPATLFKTFASALVFPTLGALMTRRVAPREQGALLGVTTALGSLASTGGPLWAGVAYDRVAPGAPYWVSAAIFGAVAALLRNAVPWRSSQQAM